MTVAEKERKNPFKTTAKKKKERLTNMKPNTEEPQQQEAQQEVQEEAQEEAQEQAQEETQTEETQQEAQTEEVQQEEAQEEPKAEEKPKRKQRTKSKNAAKKEEAAQQQEENKDPGFNVPPKTQVTFLEAVSIITPDLQTEEWKRLEKEIQDELDSIEIQEDMNPGSLRVAISELDRLQSKIRHHHYQARDAYIRLSSKEPEGVIERVKRINLGTGGNDMERRRAGTMACMYYNPDGEVDSVVNLYDIMDEARSRYYFLESVQKTIEHKSKLLITMNGALKMEQYHAVQGDDA